MKKALLLLIVVFSFANVSAQKKAAWQKIDKQSVINLEKIRTTDYSTDEQFFQLNLQELRNSLVNVEDRLSGKNGVIISLPNIDGQMEQFSVWEKSNFEPALQAQFPQIRSYIGKGITDKSATLFFSLSPKGIQTMILRADKGSEFIEPYTKDNSVYVLFDSKTRIASNLPFVCSTEDVAVNKILNPSVSRSSAGNFKTMRLALSCTGEYGVYHGGTTELALAAMNATMTRVNGVYNIDLAVQLNLIATEASIIYTDAASDPYSDAANMGNWNSELQANLTATLGNASYDIGHLFGATGGGGNAGCIGCVCVAGQKGSGITSPADGVPEGDTFDIDYVAHEMGHQLGGTHSYSFDYEGSGTNVEPGSGSTIMGYAGITGTTDVQAHSDDYFVYANVIQIQANLATKSCPVTTAPGNSAPIVNAGAEEYNIPKSTPFMLVGSATDVNADDVLTYTWEESDDSTSALTGNASKASATKAAGPNFRSFTPTATPVRFFPSLTRILNNQNTTSYEALSSVSRDLNFVLTARDNSILGGQTNQAATTVHVNANAGPFAVTSPNTNVSVAGGSNQTITWNVAGTTANGINTPYVDIYYTNSAAAGFPTLLASMVPNDGSEVVTVPNSASTTNRIMVKGHDNIFFDLSNANFTITAAPATQAIAFSGVAGEQNKNVCNEDTKTFTFDYLALGGYNTASTFSAVGNPDGTTVTFSPTSATTSGPVTMTISNLNTASSGFYNIIVTSTSGAITKTANFYLGLGVSPVTLTTPVNNAVDLPLEVNLTWAASQTATSYDVEVATDNAFANLVSTTETSSPDFNVTGLNELTDYFWRVRPKNSTCVGPYSAGNKFTTGHIVCTSTASTNIPVTVPTSGTVTSTLTIADNVTISDINITAKINHTYVEDLTVSLVSPAGTEIVLVSGQCGSSNNINATFDDAGITLTCGGTPVISGTIKPLNALSTLNGTSSAGTWTLKVVDAATPDGGSIQTWSLNICSVELLGIDGKSLFNFAVYPNPNNGTFNIQSDKLTSDKIAVTVYDMRGRLIFDKNYAGSGNFNENIQLKNAEAGVYLLSVSDGENKEVKRIVVQ
ncbi:MAG: zinc-dependent metalloprotease family protein [Flavobacterium sp.]|nr:zinc-dependent metalloprotease family protein [Flavobacterium sp.]